MRGLGFGVVRLGEGDGGLGWWGMGEQREGSAEGVFRAGIGWGRGRWVGGGCGGIGWDAAERRVAWAAGEMGCGRAWLTRGEWTRKMRAPCGCLVPGAAAMER